MRAHEHGRELRSDRPHAPGPERQLNVSAARRAATGALAACLLAGLACVPARAAGAHDPGGSTRRGRGSSALLVFAPVDERSLRASRGCRWASSPPPRARPRGSTAARHHPGSTSVRRRLLYPRRPRLQPGAHGGRADGSGLGTGPRTGPRRPRANCGRGCSAPGSAVPPTWRRAGTIRRGRCRRHRRRRGGRLGGSAGDAGGAGPERCWQAGGWWCSAIPPGPTGTPSARAAGGHAALGADARRGERDAVAASRLLWVGAAGLGGRRPRRAHLSRHPGAGAALEHRHRTHDPRPRAGEDPAPGAGQPRAGARAASTAHALRGTIARLAVIGGRRLPALAWLLAAWALLLLVCASAPAAPLGAAHRRAGRAVGTGGGDADGRTRASAAVEYALLAVLWRCWARSATGCWAGPARCSRRRSRASRRSRPTRWRAASC